MTDWLFTEPRPWAEPDYNPMPRFVLWPRLARIEDRIRRRPHIFDDQETR